MNTQTQEALKMAIEALLYGTDHTNAVKACKEALEQPAWQGLTDDEFKALMDEWSVEGKPHVGYGGAWAADGEYLTMREFVSAIEQALKEKNT